MNCPHCETELQKGVRLCPLCGKAVRRFPLWILWVAAAIVSAALIAAGVIVALHMWQDDPPSTPDTPNGDTTVTTVSNTVMVTIPEGYTVQNIASLMEEKGVCAASDFLDAVQNGDFSDYAFVASIPMTGEDGAENGRVYRLEGYLFPDTYEFYKNSSGSAAVRRFLDNFNRKLTAWQPALEQSGMTLDEAVTLASIIQWEAGKPTDMKRVSRVLTNRLMSPDYPRLQCDTTTKYLRELAAAGVTVNTEAYDTYVCRNLPVGAINNPGLDALSAAVSPSDEEICAGCYFFVTDAKNDTVYYSKTYAEHLAACREHKLGAWAE